MKNIKKYITSKINSAKKSPYIWVYFLCIIVYPIMYIFVYVLNQDFYGRQVDIQPFNTYNAENKNDSLPAVTLVLHKYLIEENAIEASLIITYNRTETFSTFDSSKLNFAINIFDGSGYTPSGLYKSYMFFDSTNRGNYGWYQSGFETERFQLPNLASVSGFPFDVIRIRPIIDLYINNNFTKFNCSIQKRIAGRLLGFKEKEQIIQLKRTKIEVGLIIVTSILFLVLTIILTHRLATEKLETNSLEKIITVAGYILATGSLKDILGITRDNGTSALEILVILWPIISIISGLLYAFNKNFKAKKV